MILTIQVTSTICRSTQVTSTWLSKTTTSSGPITITIGIPHLLATSSSANPTGHLPRKMPKAISAALVWSYQISWIETRCTETTAPQAPKCQVGHLWMTHLSKIQITERAKIPQTMKMKYRGFWPLIHILESNIRWYKTKIWSSIISWTNMPTKIVEPTKSSEMISKVKLFLFNLLCNLLRTIQDQKV